MITYATLALIFLLFSCSIDCLLEFMLDNPGIYANCPILKVKVENSGVVKRETAKCKGNEGGLRS
jgi:hypothetical protein